MSEMLRDPVWQFVGALIAFLAFIASLTVLLLQRQRKSLSYHILSQTPLFEVGEELKGKLQILYEGNAVENVHLLLIRLANTGNQPIVPQDYERLITIHVGRNARLLSAEIYESEPRDLGATLSIEGSALQISPVLMNSGDSMTIKILASNPASELEFDSRIVGVKEIGLLREERGKFYIPYFAGAILFLLGIIGDIRGHSLSRFTFVLEFIALLLMTTSFLARQLRLRRIKLLARPRNYPNRA
jgi:hypothetical protein